MDEILLLERLGHRARDLRAQRGLTRRELAERSGLSPRFLAQLEAGSGNISIRRLSQLARALGTTAAALLTDAERQHGLPVIALLGLRGAGKTTAGRRLARRLRLPFVELDQRIAEAADLSLEQLFTLHGEEYYRRLERETLKRVLDEAKPIVLATGGGLVASADTYALLRERALTIWLHASPEDHWNRVVGQGDRRPMADHPQAMAALRRLLAERRALYASAAHTVETTGRTIDEVVDALEAIVTRR